VRRTAILFIAAAALLVGGCTSSPRASTTNSVTQGPLPAGPVPSEIALMVCQSKAASEIQEVLGEKAVVTDRTWINHLYTCDYRFKSGTLVLSVKELSSWAQTLAYFNTLAVTLKKTSTQYNLGQGAFQVRNGSVVVRKDWKVLLVNVAGLPSEFGEPPTTSADVGVTVAYIILGCWAGD
jgi:hypothetical protein